MRGGGHYDPFDQPGNRTAQVSPFFCETEMTLRWKGEDDTAVDMIRALRLYRRTKEQASRVAQAAAIKAMADNLTEWAAKESKAPRPPMPGARGFTQ